MATDLQNSPRTASSSSGGRGWQAYMENIFSSQTGMSDLQWSTVAFEDFGRSAFSASGIGAQTSGTGASAQYASTGSFGGGVLKLTSTSSGAGYADYDVAGTSGFPCVTNMRTKRWMIGGRIASGTATAANDRVTFGLLGGSNIIGLGWSGAATNWQYCRGAAPTNISDTGSAIDTSGNSFRTLLLANFDLTNVAYCIDVLGGAAIVNVEAVSNLPANSFYQYMWNEGQGTSTVIILDKVIVCAEM